VRDLPRLQGVSLTLKQGQHANEMTDYRYDVVLHVGEQAAESLNLPEAQTASSEARIRDLLDTGAPVIAFTGLANARLTPVYAARTAIAETNGTGVTALRETLVQDRNAGIEPGALSGLHPDYEVVSSYFNSEDPATFDVVFRHKSQTGSVVPRVAEAATLERPGAYANQPAAQSGDQSQLSDQLRTHLRELLPDYMIPSVFVAMDTFPLTPNGKIDRKALPAPSAKVEPVQAEYIPPSNELETTIAGIWMELLDLSQVGRSDNIFDIGANSIMTAQANQRLSKKLGRRVSLVSMFRYPTVETLAAHLGMDATGPASKAETASGKPNRREEAAAKRRAMRRERVE
jgi:hypothetical protein